MRGILAGLALAASLFLHPAAAQAQWWSSGISTQYPSAWGWGSPQVNINTSYTSPYGAYSARESYPYWQFPQTGGWTYDQAGAYQPVNPYLWCRLGGSGCY